MRYMAREVTCIFIGGYTVLLIVMLARLVDGREAYERLMHALQTPLSVVLQVLALAFALYHSATWFNLTPKALPVQIGERKLPDAVIAGAHYVLWLVLSLTVLACAGAF
jgi:fumarate reductase subunit C